MSGRDGQGALAIGEPARAAQLFGAAASLRTELCAPIPAMERAEHEQILQQTRAALGDNAFTAAWEQGRALTLDAATALAAEGSP